MFLDGDDAGQESTFKTIKTLLQNNYTNIYVVKNNSNLGPRWIIKYTWTWSSQKFN
nr:hypothetical protein [Mycoplasmopsis bovis]